MSLSGICIFRYISHIVFFHSYFRQWRLIWPYMRLWLKHFQLTNFANWSCHKALCNSRISSVWGVAFHIATPSNYGSLSPIPALKQKHKLCSDTHMVWAWQSGWMAEGSPFPSPPSKCPYLFLSYLIRCRHVLKGRKMGPGCRVCSMACVVFCISDELEKSFEISAIHQQPIQYSNSISWSQPWCKRYVVVEYAGHSPGHSLRYCDLFKERWK